MSTESEMRVDDDQDIIINLEEPVTSPEGGTKPPPVPGPGSGQSTAPQAALAELEKRVEDERREREKITQAARQLAYERNQAVAYARDAEKRGMTSYEQQVDTYIQNGHEQVEALSTQYESALGAGDFRQAADINRKLGRVNAQIAVLERDKAVWNQQRQQAAAQAAQPRPQVQQPQQVQPTDPVERAIQGRTEPTKDCLRKHRDLVRGDGTLKKIAVDAHDKALDAGMTVDTDAYFRHIEQTLGGATPNSNVQQLRPQGAPTMAAPISRNSVPGGGGPGTFVMTPKMRRLAEEQGVTHQEWANGYLKLLKEGKVTPIT